MTHKKRTTKKTTEPIVIAPIFESVEKELEFLREQLFNYFKREIELEKVSEKFAIEAESVEDRHEQELEALDDREAKETAEIENKYHIDEYTIGKLFS